MDTEVPSPPIHFSNNRCLDWDAARLTLSPRQAQLFDYILFHVEQHGYQPSLAEMALRLGVRSKHSIDQILDKIEAKGLIVVNKGAARCLEFKGIKFQKVLT